MANKKQFKHVKTEVVFSNGDGNRYMVVFYPWKRPMEYAVFKNKIPIDTGTTEYGHANKTRALLFLNHAINK